MYVRSYREWSGRKDKLREMKGRGERGAIMREERQVVNEESEELMVRGRGGE